MNPAMPDHPIIRAYRPADREAVLALAPRLIAGIAPWRSETGMGNAARDWVKEAIAASGADRAAFVAIAEGDRVVGFAGVAEETNFTGERQAYLGELMVDGAIEGSGVGTALVAAVEAWAVGRDLELLVLDTGTRNERARRFYAGCGFEEEAVKLTKQLRAPG